MDNQKQGNPLSRIIDGPLMWGFMALSASAVIAVTAASLVFGPSAALTSLTAFATAVAPALIIGTAVVAGVALLRGQGNSAMQDASFESPVSETGQSRPISTSRQQFLEENKENEINPYADQGLGAALYTQSQLEEKRNTQSSNKAL